MPVEQAPAAPTTQPGYDNGEFVWPTNENPGTRFVKQNEAAAKWRRTQHDHVKLAFSARNAAVPADVASELGHIDYEHPGIWVTGHGNAPEGDALDVGMRLIGKQAAGGDARPLSAEDLYRAYKNTPHAPASVFLKYLVHRHNHADLYDDSERGHAADVDFLKLVQRGKASEKNGHVSIANLHEWTRQHAPRVMPDLLRLRDQFHNLVRQGIGLNTRSINGRAYVALTRGLDSEMMNREHPLSSHGDTPNTGFGSVQHHTWVPLDDLWYSFDHGPRYCAGTMGPEDEYLVSNVLPRYQATPEDVKSSYLKNWPSNRRFITNQTTDPELAALVRGEPDHYERQKLIGRLVKHPGVGPATAEAIAQHNGRDVQVQDLPSAYFAYPWVPRDQVLKRVQVDGHIGAVGIVQNPNLTAQDLEAFAPLIWGNRLGGTTATDNYQRAIIEAWTDHPANNSQVVERVYNSMPPELGEDLLYSPLATPNMVERAVQAFEQNKYADPHRALRFIAKNPHHTQDQARRLFNWAEQTNTFVHSPTAQKAVANLNLPDDIVERLLVDAPKQRRASRETLFDPMLSALENLGTLYVHQNPNSGPHIARLASKVQQPLSRMVERLLGREKLEPELQPMFLDLASKQGGVGDNALVDLAKTSGLTQDTISFLANHPTEAVRTALFHNKAVTPDQLRAAIPVGARYWDQSMGGEREPGSYTVGEPYWRISQAAFDREQFAKRLATEHIIKPLPVNLAKSEVDMWQAQAREWLANQQGVKGFFLVTDSARAEGILRDQAIEPTFTDELLDGEATIAHRASPALLDRLKLGPDEVVVYFETPVDPEPMDGGRFYWTHRIPVENARVENVGEGELAKMHTPLLFPKLGIHDDRRETKVVSTPLALKTFAHAAANLAVRENAWGETHDRLRADPDFRQEQVSKVSERYRRIANSSQGTSVQGNAGAGHPGYGMNAEERFLLNDPKAGSGQSSMSVAFAPSSQPNRKFGPGTAAYNAAPAAIDTTRTHEDFHAIFSRVQRVHGEQARWTLAHNLLGALPKELQESVQEHLRYRRPDLFNSNHRLVGNPTEEALTELQSYLQSAPQRDQFHRHVQHSPEQQKQFDDKMKRAWRLLTYIAPTVGQEWLTRTKPWLRKAEKPFTEPQGPLGLSAAEAHQVYLGSQRLQKSFEGLDGPNEFALRFETDPTLYAEVADRALEKMAVIHDDPERPLYVYRLQNAMGHGPYQRGGEAPHRPSRTMWQGYETYPSPSPAPEDDFSRQDFGDWIRHHDNVRFGFAHPKDAEKWFGRDGINDYEQQGFKLQRVLASKVWRSKTGKQVFFIPHQPSVKKSEDLPILPGEAVFQPGEESAARAFLGHNKEHERHLAAARFLSGRKSPIDYDLFQMALRVHDGDVARAALYAVGLTDSEKNLRALRAALTVGEFTPEASLSKNEPGSPHIESVTPGSPDADETANEVARAVTAGLIQPLKLGGKHSKGAMAARDPKTGNVWLLKPGSGKMSPAAGARDDASSQSAREAAFWHVMNRVGLGNYGPRADLLIVNGAQVAAMKLLGTQWHSLDEQNRKVDGYAREVLTPYLQRGDVHRLAAILWVLGETDAHGQNVMTHAESIAIIDHGSAWAGPSFNPGHDTKSFIPYVLRVFAGTNLAKLKPEERLRHMPELNQVQDAAFRKWLHGIDPAVIVETGHAHGIGQVAVAAAVKRLHDLQSYAGPSLSSYLNGLWAGVVAS